MTEVQTTTMNILTLGAAGFIGSHLTHRLLQEGHTVVAVDLESDKISEHLNNRHLTFVQQDIRTPGWDLDEKVRDADLVIDLIAYANPGLYLRIPLEVFPPEFRRELKDCRGVRPAQQAADPVLDM